MPLSSPAPRKLMHTRAIECRGYEREDGLWDIEAHLTDTKTTPHTRREGGRERRPGEPVHDMWIRVKQAERSLPEEPSGSEPTPPAAAPQSTDDYMGYFG